MNKIDPANNRFYLNRKLIGVVTVFIIAASGLVVLTNFSVNTIAATGDYMRLLSTWSQYQHQSMMQLERYARGGDQVNYREYVKSTTRMNEQAQVIDELFEADPNVKVIFDAFSSKNVYPNEISSLILTFQQFRRSDRMQNLYRKWQQLKQIEYKKQEIAQNLYQVWNEDQPDENQSSHNLAVLNELNQDWNIRNQQLMAEVGNAAGVIKRAGLWISVILGILLVLIGVVVTVRANKSIGRWEHTLNEKEVLLSEIHHRVKNNMAVISGLLELESMENSNPRQALQNSRDRIQSMSMIHEILYQSDSFSEINLNQYLQKLTNFISDTYTHDQKEINLRNHFEDITLNINQAVPVGLIMNEVLTNTIVHGFDTMDNTEIDVFLTEMNGRISLSIKNNGENLPEKLDNELPESSGLMIVRTLVQQLQGELIHKNGNGVVFNLKFMKSNAAGSSNAKL